MTRFFDEENSVYYNLALHLLNILLLFLVLRKFRAGDIFSLISVLLFAVFGRFRYLDSSSVMIGGSGLNLFFILTAFLFLIKCLETRSYMPMRKYSFFAISLLAYSSLVFSYEVAIPLLAPLAMVFCLFPGEGQGVLARFKSKKIFCLLIYLIPLAVYYIVFLRLFVESSYDGARIVWSLDIFTRLKSYVMYSLPPFQTHGYVTAEFIILILYFTGILLALKSVKPGIDISVKQKTGLEVLLFSAVFYLSTIVLFILNDWMTPTSVMLHHTYLMSAAGAILMTSLIYNLQWILPASFRKKFLAILIILIFPIILLNGERHIFKHYRNDKRRVNAIKTIKKGIQAAVLDIEKPDAIILKNFFRPYYGISTMDGALLKWFGFKKHILSGREITSARGGDIVFKGPLHRYLKPEAHKVRSERVRIFFVNKKDGAVLPYNDLIDFEKSLNLYQTAQVRRDCNNGVCDDPRTLEAILSNFKENSRLNIWFKSPRDTQNFLKNVTSIELNDERVPAKRISVSGGSLRIDISSSTHNIKYVFLKVVSLDDSFKQSLRRISLTGASI
ncbi:MAG: hypothetical protein ACE5DR_00870 [Thermodesulfobacteriota bacterium]